MADFASLLNQFKKQTPSTSSSSSAKTRRKRPHPSSSADNVTSTSNHRNHAMNARQSNNNPFFQHLYPYNTPVERIYIACPAFTETGGPEALHQLCHVINTGDYFVDANNKDESNNAKNNDGVTTKNGTGVRIKACMLYLRERSSTPSGVGGGKDSVEHIRTVNAKPSKYNRYDAPPADTLPGVMECNSDKYSYDEKCHHSSELVIWPECWTHLIDSLQPSSTSYSSPANNKIKRYQIAIWWLSVNNNKGRFLPEQFQSRKDILHLVQSAYARYYVQSNIMKAGTRSKAQTKGGNDNYGDGDDKRVLEMTEFIPHATTATSPTETKKDRGTVVYNPIKGIHYTDEIIRRACGKNLQTLADGSVIGSGIKFTPIGKGVNGRDRMSGDEVVALLKRANVYIDFGPHPGMDRIPREAALAGCIVITNREGAADFDEDVPLPPEFKFKDFDVDKIFAMLKECCCNDDKYNEYIGKMHSYRKWILGQKDVMKLRVNEFIGEITTKRINNQRKMKSSEKEAK